MAHGVVILVASWQANPSINLRIPIMVRVSQSNCWVWICFTVQRVKEQNVTDSGYAERQAITAP